MTEPTTELISFDYEGQRVAFDPMARMWSLTEMHQAAGGEPSKAPRFWLRQEQAQGLIEALAARSNVSQDHIWDDADGLVQTRRGNQGGTWAHWQIAAAYAHYLRPDFYLQWNEWAMERVTGRGQLDSSRLAAVEARLAALEGKRQRVQTTPALVSVERASVLSAMRQLGGRATPSEICTQLGHPRWRTVHNQLYRLTRCGTVRHMSYGLYELVATDESEG